MPLINLLQDCAKVFGDQIASPTGKKILLADVNTAALRIWDDNDLVGSIREETICTNVEEGLQVLPWYMNRVRGAKIHSTRQKITLIALNGYYQTYGFFQSPFTMRVAAPCVTTYNLDTATQLTVTLQAAEEVKTSVTIVGTTSKGFTVSETLIFNPGELSKTTVNQYRATGNNPVRDALKSITRSTLTVSDTLITDLSGRVVSFIPGRRYTAEFTIFQLYDQLRFVIDLGYDVMYKMPFLYFVDDADSLLGDIYNEAIYYQFIANRYRRSNQADAIVRAQDAENKVREIVQSVTSNQEGPIQTTIDFGTNQYNGLITSPNPIGRSFGPYRDEFSYYGGR